MAGRGRASQHTAMSSLSTAVITELAEFISSNAQLNSGVTELTTEKSHTNPPLSVSPAES